MSTQPPSATTHAKGVPPLYLTLTEVGDIRQHPKNAKRTQSPVRARHAVPLLRKTNPIPAHQVPPPRYLCETNPILSRGRAKKCETNPICPYPSPAHPPKTQNKPNSRPANSQKTRNKPNSTSQHPIYHPTSQKMQNKPNLQTCRQP